MDDFKSYVEYVEPIVGDVFPIDHITCDSFVADDGIDFQPLDLAWGDGGITRIMRDVQRKFGDSGILYFRGAALFDNFDDAKNEYLNNPVVDTGGCGVYQDAHQPFGMVIPRWRDAGFGAEQHEYRDRLAAITVILMWQEHME